MIIYMFLNHPFIKKNIFLDFSMTLLIYKCYGELGKNQKMTIMIKKYVSYKEIMLDIHYYFCE